MKKTIAILILATFFSIAGRAQTGLNDVSYESYIRCQDTAIINTVGRYLQSENVNYSRLTYDNNVILFNYDSLYYSKVNGVTTDVFYYKSNITDTAKSVLLSFSILNGAVESSMICGSTGDKSSRTVEFFDNKFNKFATVVATESTQQFDITSISPNVVARACGQATMNCINDLYTNHGWTSLLLWVSSAVDPVIAVIAAGSCALTSCIRR